MAMTKKERSALDAAITAARINRALRWSDVDAVRPDVPPPNSFDTTVGWMFNAHADGDRGRVERAWSGSTSHGTGARSPDRSATQGARHLYSSKVLALRAMRCEMEKRFAAILADVDRQIEEAGD